MMLHKRDCGYINDHNMTLYVCGLQKDCQICYIFMLKSFIFMKIKLYVKTPKMYSHFRVLFLVYKFKISAFTDNLTISVGDPNVQKNLL